MSWIQRNEDAKKDLNTIVNLAIKISNTVDEGFARVNEKLDDLEGSTGMQGVIHNLGDIKTYVKLHIRNKHHLYVKYNN